MTRIVPVNIALIIPLRKKLSDLAFIPVASALPVRLPVLPRCHPRGSLRIAPLH